MSLTEKLREWFSTEKLEKPKSREQILIEDLIAGVKNSSCERVEKKYLSEDSYSNVRSYTCKDIEGMLVYYCGMDSSTPIEISYRRHYSNGYQPLKFPDRRTYKIALKLLAVLESKIAEKESLEERRRANEYNRLLGYNNLESKVLEDKTSKLINLGLSVPMIGGLIAGGYGGVYRRE